MNIFKFEIGAEMRDRVSGFTGIATGRADYIAGCRQYCLTPKAGTDGALKDAHWFDEERLELTGRNGVTIEASPTGGPSGSECAPTR